MDADASLLVEVSRAEHEPMRQWVRIRISYTSSLEDVESLERAFEPSWTGESEELPIAYTLVKKMNGLLTARLEAGHTVHFEIYLPQAEAAATGVSPNRTGEPAIMLVEPNTEVRHVLVKHFEQNACNVLEAASCGEAVLLAELYDGPIPLVIANPAKGNETRKELASALKAIKSGVSVRLLDGYWEERETEESQALSPRRRFLTKTDLLGWAKTALGRPDRLPAADSVSAG